MLIGFRPSFACLVFALCGCTSLLGAQSTVPPNYVLQWTDPFTGSALNTTTWNYRTDIKAKSAQLPANVSLDGHGHMVIALRHQPFAGQQFTGGGIVSKAAFRYGYFEVKAKTTTNPGWHSSFWLFAGNGSTTFAPGGLTEIDDFEIDSAHPEVISMGRLEWANAKAIASQRCNAHFKPGYSTAAEFHTYGLEWTENQITYYLDGAKICTQDYPPTQYTHDELNLWLTAIGYGSDVAVTDPSSGVSFADAAYYIRDYYIGNGEPGYVEYGPGWRESLEPGFSKIPARQSCLAGAFATYNPTILQAGRYDVELYALPGTDGDSGASFTIQHAAGATRKKINLTASNTGWVDLGDYSFAPGSGGSLTVANSGDGCIRTSMVKFVRHSREPIQ
ncbi:MAG TPA: family 16 glycosylhydrolase [Terriglobia bacterium]|nr:family 16 glycosylhydrolase [Terriglobia bacterium]